MRKKHKDTVKTTQKALRHWLPTRGSGGGGEGLERLEGLTISDYTFLNNFDF